MIIATIILVVIASVCTIALVVILVLKWHIAKRKTTSTDLERPVSRLSHRSFLSPNGKIPAISAPIPQHTSSLFRDLKDCPFRPDRPAQPWGEDISSDCVDKKRLSRPTSLVKAFSVQRSRSSTYSQLSPPAGGRSPCPPFVPPQLPRRWCSPVIMHGERRLWTGIPVTDCHATIVVPRPDELRSRNLIHSLFPSVDTQVEMQRLRNRCCRCSSSRTIRIYIPPRLTIQYMSRSAFKLPLGRLVVVARLRTAQRSPVHRSGTRGSGPAGYVTVICILPSVISHR